MLIGIPCIFKVNHPPDGHSRVHLLYEKKSRGLAKSTWGLSFNHLKKASSSFAARLLQATKSRFGLLPAKTMAYWNSVLTVLVRLMVSLSTESAYCLRNMFYHLPSATFPSLRPASRRWEFFLLSKIKNFTNIQKGNLQTTYIYM